MAKHKYYDMIVAKAADMKLVVCTKHEDVGWRAISQREFMPVYSDNEYFLCLPQHKEACLHWLNGGSLQDFFEGSWTSVDDFEGEDWVEADNMFMNEEYQFKVKPKKEKRWIAIEPRGASAEVFFDEKIIDNCIAEPEYKNHQKVEIEVEVYNHGK